MLKSLARRALTVLVLTALAFGVFASAVIGPSSTTATPASANPYDSQPDFESSSPKLPDLDTFGVPKLYTYCNLYNNIPAEQYAWMVQQIQAMDADDSTWIAGESCSASTDGLLVNDTNTSNPGYAACLTSYGNICDSFKVAINLNIVFAGSVQEAGGVYNAFIYAWNIKHVIGHEAGHSMGSKHNGNCCVPPIVCGPTGAASTGALEVMGPDYPCSTEPLRQSYRLHFSLHTAQHIQCWYNDQDLPGGGGCN